MSNKHLYKAKNKKNDEFYTQLKDIRDEVDNYKEQLKGKIIYCPADHPNKSNFIVYFKELLKLGIIKKLISTWYNPNGTSFKTEYYLDNGSLIEKRTNLSGNGDFRSDECKSILKKSDIVITNPPFSLFREFVKWVLDSKKDLLVIGTLNVITYKNIFILIRHKVVSSGYKCDKSFEFDTDNNTKKKISGICWFTNLQVNKKRELILTKSYKPENYPKYENYDAINIDRIKDIPNDYYDLMGVPITFIEKWNPEQFEIIALGIVGSIKFTSNKKMEILKKGRPTGKYTYNAKGNLYRLFNPERDKYPTFKDVETGKLYSSIYARLIIKRK